MGHCTDYDDGSFDHTIPHGVSILTEHNWGAHTWRAHTWGGTNSEHCTYVAGPWNPVNHNYDCNVTATSSWSGAYTSETGEIAGWSYSVHLPGQNEYVKNGSMGFTSTSYGNAAMNTVNCDTGAIPQYCNYTSIGFDGNGQPIFYYHLTGYGHFVDQYILPTMDVNACRHLTSTLGSPVVVDMEGKDFDDAFTDVEHGVFWDFFGRGSGKEVHIAWTNPDRDIEFLALDKKSVCCGFQQGDGILHSSKLNLFGNLSWQPIDPDKAAERVRSDNQAYAATGEYPVYHGNGFLALAMFDERLQGGNGDGRIDKNDAIWKELRLCRFRPPNVSFAGNCGTMDEAGVLAIPLQYRESSRTDEYGNQMRYVGTIVMKQMSATVPKIYDVFLQARE